MDKEDKKIPEQYQEKLKDLLGLSYLTRAKIDAYSANLYLLKDIVLNQKKSKVHKLGWTDPEAIPFYPIGDSFRAPSSGSGYNLETVAIGEKMIEYDFKEAYPTIMRSHKLPSNTFLKNVSYDRDKIEKRFSEYPEKQPYKRLSTFSFFKVEIVAKRKEETYWDKNSFLARYPGNLMETITLSEIELKLLYDFYDIKKLNVLDSYTFRTQDNLLEDYFSRIEKVKEAGKIDSGMLKNYKKMRNKCFGLIAKGELGNFAKDRFEIPIYNRAYSAMVAGVFRDVMARYEQKYVHSEYGLLLIKTDGIYFKKEVPEFEKLLQVGMVRKHIHTITEDSFKRARG
ncbi:hypothetical protein K5G30_002390 [Enterococcus faecalis]|nr:hypothetical protein [Enterococcus faecalis]